MKLRAMSDFLFHLPVNFRPLEEYDQELKPERSRPGGP